MPIMDMEKFLKQFPSQYWGACVRCAVALRWLWSLMEHVCLDLFMSLER